MKNVIVTFIKSFLVFKMYMSKGYLTSEQNWAIKPRNSVCNSVTSSDLIDSDELKLSS